MQKLLFTVFILAIGLSSINANSTRIVFNDFGMEIDFETRDLYFYELLNYWSSATPGLKAMIEEAVDAGEFRRPSEHFESPLVVVEPNDPSGGFFQYIRLKESVIGGDAHAGFHTWFLAWFREAHKLGPQYRAKFLAFEAYDDANRAAFDARLNPSVLVLVDQYRELGRQFLLAAGNPDLTFGQLYDLMQEKPSLTPHEDNEQRRQEAADIASRSMRNAAFLWEQGEKLGRQQLLDIAGEYDALAAAATQLEQEKRVTRSALRKLYERGAALFDQQRTLRAARPTVPEAEEVFSEVSLTSDSSSDDEAKASEKKRPREEEVLRDGEDEPRNRLVLRLKLTPAMVAALKGGQGPSPGGSGI